MNATFDLEELVRCITYHSPSFLFPITQHVADVIKLADPTETVAHIEPSDAGNTALPFELWTREGWQNEQQRRAYIARLPQPVPLPPPKLDAKTTIRQQIEIARARGDETTAKMLEIALANL